MKRYLTAAAALLFCATAANAQSPDSQISLSVLGGWSSHPDLTLGATRPGMDDGYNVGARLGYDMSTRLPWPGISLDADYFYNQSDYRGSASGARLGSSSFMGDITYHAPISPAWDIYGGGGAGAVHDDLDGNLHGSSTVFGWQALGGVEYAMSPATKLFAEYRYQNAHDANIGGMAVGNTSNNLSMGVKFSL